MRILNVVETAYRGTLEEQDDTILWLSHALRNAGANLDVLLRGNAVNYLVDQECPALVIGTTGVNHPARPGVGLRKLQENGAKVFAILEDIEQRGIGKGEWFAGVEPIGRGDVAALFDDYEQVWHW